MTQSSELTAGAGFNYEAAVAAFYMIALLGEESAPALNNRVVKWIGLQQKCFGEPLDDVIVDAHSTNGEIARLSLQVKRSLIISAAASNNDFLDIVQNSWRTGESAPCRHPIPVQVGTLIRNMPAGDSGASRQVFCDLAE
jgi:hypothetical protein